VTLPNFLASALARYRTTDARQQRVTQEQAILARWLTEAEQANRDPTGRHAWQLYQSPIFAELWYAAREAGERVRARAMAQLYAHRAQPGGRYPDPREEGAFSVQAILTAAARSEGLQIRTYPLADPDDSDDSDDSEHASGPTDASSDAGAGDDGGGRRHTNPPDLPYAWLITYPPSPTGQRIPPQLWMHPPTDQYPLGRALFELACLLGYITREPRLLDPDAPHGMITLPQEPGIIMLMHHFAYALLHLAPICPPELGCSCAVIRQRFTAPPADHPQPTQTLTLADLAREIRAPHRHR